MATTITNMCGIPLRHPTIGRLHIHNIIRAVEPGSVPSTLGDFRLEFHFNPLLDLSSSANALSFISGILPAVNYEASAEIADQIATFAFNHVSSRDWCYGLLMSVELETNHVFEERRSREMRDDLLDSVPDLSDLVFDRNCCGDTLGLSEREISMLRREEVTGDEEGECCCICLEGFIRGVVITSLSPCSHRFHYDCIVQWLQNKRTCPICRSSTVPIS